MEYRAVTGGDFEYNRDLYLGERAVSQLRERHPKIWFALGQPAPAALFAQVDDQAKTEKKRFRTFGYISVAAATSALWLASLEPTLIAPAVYAGSLNENWATVVAVIASLAGFASVLIGWLGMGISERKRMWLRHRLLAERMRQWQWQHFVGTLPKIAVASRGTETLNAYLANRVASFREFQSGYADQIDARLNETLGAAGSVLAKIWLDPQWLVNARNASQSSANISSKEYEEIFEAYRRERIQGQVDYVAWMLGPGKFATHASTQQKRLHAIGRFIVAAILSLHVLILAGVFFHIAELKSVTVYVCTLLLALGALAVRVVEDGLRPSEQIARLRAYSGAIAKARERFEAGDTSEKIAAMIDLEEAAVVETLQFVRANNEASYVM